MFLVVGRVFEVLGVAREIDVLDHPEQSRLLLVEVVAVGVLVLGLAFNRMNLLKYLSSVHMGSTISRQISFILNSIRRSRGL